MNHIEYKFQHAVQQSCTTTGDTGQEMPYFKTTKKYVIYRILYYEACYCNKSIFGGDLL